MSFAFCARLVVSYILLVIASQPNEHVERFMMRKEAEQAHVTRHKQDNSAHRMREWEADHPPLPSPWFWFWGRPCRTKIGASTPLLENTPTLMLPSKEPYNLDNKSSVYHSQRSQDLILEPILRKISKGFFVESGASDGERDSNTLFYEMKHGWSGLLIEPSNRDFQKILTKHRRAFAFHGCLSPDGQAKTIQYINDKPGLGKILTTEKDMTGSLSESEAQPLHALLEAAGQRCSRRRGICTVDFWSLDIEGSEGAVLLSTDFSKIEVGVLLIEMNKSGKNNDQIKDAMDKAGFKNIGHSSYDGGDGVLDRIFINPLYFERRNLEVPTPAVLQIQYRDE